MTQVNNIETNTPFFLNDFNLGNRDNSPNYPQFYNDQWFLVVGHINPFGTRAIFSDKDESGIYLPSVSGTKLRVLHCKSADSPMITFNSPSSTLISGDWLNRSDTKKVRLVAKQHGNASGRFDVVQFYAPRIDEINGSEPSIKELTSGDVVYNRPPNRDVYNIPISSWNDKIHNTRNTLIGDKKHAIENNTFDIKVNETHENYNFADYVSGTTIDNIGIEDTIITLEIGSGTTPITLPIDTFAGEGGLGNLTLCNVDWGDGTIVSIIGGSDSNLTHSYTSAGTYTVTITGTYFALDIGGKGGGTGVTNFKSKVRTFYLGSAPLKELAGAFDGCTGLTTFTTAAGVTNTSGVTNLSTMFNGCTGLTTVDVRGMDTSNVTTMYQMFKNVGTVSITGLHTFSLKSIEANNAASGLADFLESSTLNVEEHERTLIAWSNDTETPDTVYYDMGSSQYGFGNSLASGSSVPVVDNAAEKLFNTKTWIETPSHPTNRDASR